MYNNNKFSLFCSFYVYFKVLCSFFCGIKNKKWCLNEKSGKVWFYITEYFIHFLRYNRNILAVKSFQWKVLEFGFSRFYCWIKLFKSNEMNDERLKFDLWTKVFEFKLCWGTEVMELRKWFWRVHRNKTVEVENWLTFESIALC